MKDKKIVYSIVTWMLTAMLVITLTACTDSSENKKTISEDETSTEEIRQEMQDLIQALGTYTADQRDEAIERTQSALDGLDKRIDELETRIDSRWEQMNEAAREKTSANLKVLREKRTEVAEWYGKLKTSSADAWDHVKKGFSEAYKDFSDAWGKAEEELDINNP